MANEDQYTIDAIVRIAVPEWTPTSDGKWERVWRVGLEAPIAVPPAALPNVSEPTMSARINVLEDLRTLEVTMTTSENPMSDEAYYFIPYTILRKVDGMVGRIAQIQGQPRAVWQPFRSETR